MGRRIRVLYLQPASLFGGAERQAATVIPLLRRSGIDVVTLVGPGRLAVDWLQERGVQDIVYTLDFPGGWRKPRGLERLTLPWRYVRCRQRIAAEVERLVEERHVDLVYAALPFSWIAATPAARRRGVPIVWRAGGTEISPAVRTALRGWSAFNSPDLLVCCSESVKRTFGPTVRAPAEVVLNGVDTTQWHPAAADPARLRPREARLVVGFAARLVGQKRPEDILALAARIAPQHADVVFLIAGEGSRRAEYERQTEAMGLRRSVRFLGYVADMRAFYAACDIFILPSRSEGCPNVVLEAMAMRRAVVVSDVAGTREILRDRREGLVYPIGDIDRLTDAVSWLIAEPSLRQALAERSYRRVVNELSADAAARKLGALLDLVARRASRVVHLPPRRLELPSRG